MKKLFFAVVMLLCMVNHSSYAQSTFTVNGNTYSAVKSATTTSNNVTATPYTYKVKDVEYPIFLSVNGCAFIVKTSQKTGNEYKQYLGPEISKDICKKMGIEYKGK